MRVPTGPKERSSRSVSSAAREGRAVESHREWRGRGEEVDRVVTTSGDHASVARAGGADGVRRADYTRAINTHTEKGIGDSKQRNMDVHSHTETRAQTKRAEKNRPLGYTDNLGRTSLYQSGPHMTQKRA